jgi:hypothetical protein
MLHSTKWKPYFMRSSYAIIEDDAGYQLAFCEKFLCTCNENYFFAYLIVCSDELQSFGIIVCKACWLKNMWQ